MPHALSIDLETYSSVPIRETGAWKYIESDDFEILLLAYSLDGAPVQVIDLASGETVPEWLINALTDPAYIKHAYNAPFEFGCLQRVYGGMIPSQWRCTMFHGLYCGYTAGLDATGKALGIARRQAETCHRQSTDPVFLSALQAVQSERWPDAEPSEA